MYNRTSYSSHQSTITFYQLIIQVWEQDELSSGSEEALRHSNDSLRAPSAAEEMSTDDSGVQLNVIGRSKPKKSTHPRDTGCLPSGYIPQVSTLYYHIIIRTHVIEILFCFPIVSSFAQRFYHWAISISVSLWRTTDWLRPTICRPTAPAGLRHGF